MKFSLPFVAMVSASGLFALVAEPISAQAPVKRDPNEKICQVIKPIGSRLGGKKICATRAEWDDKQRQDREATERAQTQICVIDPSTGRCGGQ